MDVDGDEKREQHRRTMQHRNKCAVLPVVRANPRNTPALPLSKLVADNEREKKIIETTKNH